MDLQQPILPALELDVRSQELDAREAAVDRTRGGARTTGCRAARTSSGAVTRGARNASRRGSPSCAKPSRRSRALRPSSPLVATVSRCARKRSPPVSARSRRRSLPRVASWKRSRRESVGSSTAAAASRRHGRSAPACGPSRSAVSAPASRRTSLYTRPPRGALAQLGERRLCKAEVAGSIPARSTVCRRSDPRERIRTSRRPLKGRFAPGLGLSYVLFRVSAVECHSIVGAGQTRGCCAREIVPMG